MIIPFLILFFVLVVEMIPGNGLLVNSGKISGADGDVLGLEEDAVRFYSIMNVGCGKQSSFVQVLCVAAGRYIIAPIVNLKYSGFNTTVKCMFAGFVAYSNRVLCCGFSQFAGFSFIRKAISFNTPPFVTFGIASQSSLGTHLTSSCLPGASLSGIISIASCPREAAVACFAPCSIPHFRSPIFDRT
jgi:hypothetical protein